MRHSLTFLLTAGVMSAVFASTNTTNYYAHAHLTIVNNSSHTITATSRETKGGINFNTGIEGWSHFSTLKSLSQLSSDLRVYYARTDGSNDETAAAYGKLFYTVICPNNTTEDFAVILNTNPKSYADPNAGVEGDIEVEPVGYNNASCVKVTPNKQHWHWSQTGDTSNASVTLTFS